jgi:hypothetical protein
MFRDPENPESSVLFLYNWDLELRAGFTPDEELDAINRLNEDYLEPDEPPEAEAGLIAEVTAAAEQILRRAREEEAKWSSVTMNDRLTAAFASLERNGIFAKERCGATIQDGWGHVGLGATRKQRGAVFYHQEDVFDALNGKSLLLAFGGCSSHPSSPAEDAVVAEQALDVLGRFGIGAEWSGRVEDRISIAPFVWQRRRWTQPPQGVESSAVRWTRAEQQLQLLPIPGDERIKYEQMVIARRTTYAFDHWLSTIMRRAWTLLGGERGQFGHTGDPFVFVPAGEHTRVAPQNALTNLGPDDSARIRSRADRIRVRNRPWWKIWP